LGIIFSINMLKFFDVFNGFASQGVGLTGLTLF